MSAELFRTRDSAIKIAGIVPLKPYQIQFDSIFPKYESFLYGLKGIRLAQIKLEQAREKQTLNVDPGVKAKVLYFDGASGVVAGYDPDGNFSGFGQAIWNPDKLKRENRTRFMCFDVAYVVIPGDGDIGLATAMMNLLEGHIATNNVGMGAIFSSTVETETPQIEDIEKTLAASSGAILARDKIHYIRILMKPKYYDKGKKGTPGIIRLSNGNVIETNVNY